MALKCTNLSCRLKGKFFWCWKSSKWGESEFRIQIIHVCVTAGSLCTTLDQCGLSILRSGQRNASLLDPLTLLRLEKCGTAGSLYSPQSDPEHPLAYATASLPDLITTTPRGCSGSSSLWDILICVSRVFPHMTYCFWRRWCITCITMRQNFKLINKKSGEEFLRFKVKHTIASLRNFSAFVIKQSDESDINILLSVLILD